MVNKLLWILFILLPIGCAELPKAQRTIDPRLLPYMVTLEQYYGVETTISAHVKPLNDNIVGRCSIQGKSRIIYIDTEYFNTSTHDNVEEVMLHEFGHCAFNLEHHGEVISSGPMQNCISSAMHPYVMLSYTHCWRDFRDYYYEEIHSTQKNDSGGPPPSKYERSNEIL